MNDSASLELVLTGKIVPCNTLGEVKQKLVELLKQTPAAIDAMFAAAPVTIKRNLSPARGQEYVDAFLKAGALASLQTHEWDLPLSAVSAEAKPPSQAEREAALEKKYRANPDLRPVRSLMSQRDEAIDIEPVIAANSTKFFSLSARGRINRIQYSSWVLAFVASQTIFWAMIIANMASTPHSTPISLIMLDAATAPFALFVVFRAMVLRLHDLNKSGWLSLIFLVPVVNVFFAVYLRYAAGTEGRNAYGPQPASASRSSYALLIISIVLIGLSFVSIFRSAGKIDKQQVVKEQATVAQ